MTTAIATQLAYTRPESIGIGIVIGCGAVSVISVMTVFGILGVSAVQSRRSPNRNSSNKNLFVHTHVAIYFISLLMSNVIQAIGGIMNLRWVVAGGVSSGVACTIQAAFKEFGNIGTALFCCAITAHTFSQLFLRLQWSRRTCYIVLAALWALTLLEVCIEAFAIAKPKENGPYFGVSGLWCWITAAYPIPRYVTSYLLMFISAALSIILYSLVFFRLRGNITVSAGYKIHFHRRPKVRVGRTRDGTYIVTDDQRVESHLNKVAKHMLLYPVIFTLIVLPTASTRFSAFNGASVPISVTIFSSGLFNLHGFINTILFCSTRNILPESWRRRLGLGSALDGGRRTYNLSSRAPTTPRVTGLDAKIQTIGAGSAPVVLSVGVEKDVEITYDDAQLSPKYVTLGSSSMPLTPNPLPRVQGRDEERFDTHNHHIKQPSFPPRPHRVG